jgi:2-polyprenyl-6-methoxyphenol hydroxylase-like FAD-dependent oxidoreductase
MTGSQAGTRPAQDRYDAVIAGARVAGAATAMLLARQGLRVLVVDPMRRGSDTLSTHALMRGAIVQLSRWGVLDAIRGAGTPTIRSTAFHYGDERIDVPIKTEGDIDGLYAPRRTVLDAVLLDAAEASGAEVVLGHSIVGLLRDPDGRVRGARIAGPDRRERDVAAPMVIGADGLRSRVARMVEARPTYAVPNATASIYGYFQGIGLEGFHWFYQTGAGVGAIPTNDGDTCVFVSIPPARFADRGADGLEGMFREALEYVSPMLAERVAASSASGKLRGFAGHPGFLRQPVGPGWALVGDAAYFKDPLTAHGMTDAMRDAELLARAVAAGGDASLAGYQAARDGLVRGLLDVTDRIASFEWDLEEVKELHRTLSREMKAEVKFLKTLDRDAAATRVA